MFVVKATSSPVFSSIRARSMQMQVLKLNVLYLNRMRRRLELNQAPSLFRPRQHLQWYHLLFLSLSNRWALLPSNANALTTFGPLCSQTAVSFQRALQTTLQLVGRELCKACVSGIVLCALPSLQTP